MIRLYSVYSVSREQNPKPRRKFCGNVLRISASCKAEALPKMAAELDLLLG